MILVTLGTQDKPFKRLIEAVEEQIDKGNITDEVIVQAGCTEYNSNKMQIIDYIPFKEFSKLLEKTDFIISHAGVASIIEGLKNNKKVIAVPRKQEYGEHVNNHQEQILNSLGEEGYIIPVYDLKNIEEALNKVKDFKPKKFEGNEDIFLDRMTEEIEKIISNY